MKFEQDLAILERTPRRQRAQVMHDMVVASIASRPDSEAAKVTAALRCLAAKVTAAADAHENTRWEASFQRKLS